MADGERPDLETLIELSRHRVMTAAEREAQRRSFAYGNAHLSNPNVTRTHVDTAAAQLDEDENG